MQFRALVVRQDVNQLSMIASDLSSDGSAASRFSSLKNNLRCSVRDGGCWGAMVGLGEHYIPAFALAAGLGEVTAGWIASLPILAGACCKHFRSARSLGWDRIKGGLLYRALCKP